MFSQVSVYSQGGSWSLSNEDLCPGVSLSGGLGPGGSLSRGGSLSTGSLSRGSLSGGSLSRGISPGFLCPGGSLSRGGLVTETPCMVMTGRYASYWNAFLFNKLFRKFRKHPHFCTVGYEICFETLFLSF